LHKSKRAPREDPERTVKMLNSYRLAGSGEYSLGARGEIEDN